MNTLILYVLKSTLISGIFYTWYMLALKNRRMHGYNRFFLLMTLCAGVLLPLVHIQWWPVAVQRPAALSSAQVLLHTIGDGESIPAAAAITTADKETDLPWLMVVAAIAISAVLLVRLMAKILWLLRMGRRYPQTKHEGVVVVHTDLPEAPFSFMNRIYWRDNIPMETGSGRMILMHELAHTRQKHSYDKLAAQLLAHIFWMNPFYRLVHRELGMVHEFMADEEALAAEQSHTEAFATMLLEVHYPGGNFSPGHRFYSSPIKRRLDMLQKNNRIPAAVWRRAAVLPLVAGSILIFGFGPRTTPTHAHAVADKKIVLVVDAGHGGSDEGCRWAGLVEKDLNLEIAKRIQGMAADYNVEVHLTRSEDKQVSLEERVALANRLHPDGFISLHIDDQPAKATGKGTFDIAIHGKNALAGQSRKLAYAIYKSAARPEWEQKDQLSEKGAHVLKENPAAAVLIEIGNIRNRQQMQYLANDAQLTELCSHILEGVVAAHQQ